VTLLLFSPNAIKGLISGSDRKAAIDALLNSVGGKLESMMFTRGKFDIAVICDLPNESIKLGLGMAIQASGEFSRMITLDELEMEPIIAAAQKAAKIYVPAG